MSRHLAPTRWSLKELLPAPAGPMLDDHLVGLNDILRYYLESSLRSTPHTLRRAELEAIG